MRRNNGDNPGTIDSPYGGGATVPGYTDGNPQGFPPPAPNASEVEARSLNDLQENLKTACVEGTGLPGPAPADPSDDRFELARSLNSSINAVTGPTDYVRSGLTFDTDPGDFIADHLPGIFVCLGRKYHATAERLAAVEVEIGGLPAGTGFQFTLSPLRDHYVYLGIQVGSEFATDVVIQDVPVGDPAPLLPAGMFLSGRIRTGVAGTTEVLYFNHGARASSAGEPAGDGLVGIGGDDGSGLRGVAGANGASGEAGVVGEGIGATPGVLGTGGDTGGAGVHGEAAIVSEVGVRGVADSAGTISGAGVEGVGASNAPGVRGIGLAGHGVVAESDLTSPERSSLLLVPQDSDPNTQPEGSVWTLTDGELRVAIDSFSRTVWSTPDGLAYAGADQGSATNNNSVAWTTIATTFFANPYVPKRLGTVHIVASAEFGSIGGADLQTTFDVRVRDETAGVDVWTRTIDHPNATAGPVYDRSWSIDLLYTNPSGARTFSLQFKRVGAGATGVQAIDGAIVIKGIY